MKASSLSFPPSVFLAEQFESLQSHLDAMMPAAKKPFLQQFYSQASKSEDHLLPQLLSQGAPPSLNLRLEPHFSLPLTFTWLTDARRLFSINIQ